MAIAEIHVADPTQRKTQMRVAPWRSSCSLRGLHSAHAERRSRCRTGAPAATAEPQAKKESSATEIAEGQRIFRFETFGDEQLWTDTLHLNEVVEKNVDPTTALKVGLKVDATYSLPAPSRRSISRVRHDGRAAQDERGRRSAGHSGCRQSHHAAWRHLRALSFHRGQLDHGWHRSTQGRLAEPRSQCGSVIALSPALAADKKAVYQSWGPGKYDPRYNQDGKSTPLVLPPAYGLAQVKNETYTAEGPISYWNAYVAVTQMGGQGNFSDPRLGIEVKHSPDMVTSKLPALRAYQHSLPAPPPPAGSFDAAIAERGRGVFDRTCASCHIGGSGTDNNGGALHPPADTGVDGAYAARTANKAYRTTPLRALWQHAPYFHDGSAPRSPTSWRITTGFANSVSPPSSSESSWSI
jgi:hypothetical protein